MSSTLLNSSHTEHQLSHHENKLIVLWSITNLIVVMNTTMFNIAVPFVLEDFALSSSTASWLVSGYSIMFAISTLTFSRLSDFVPLSRLLIYGISLLGIASVIGFFAHHFFVLLLARIVQAAGAGSVMGLSMVLTGRYIPFERRGKAMAMIASSAALAFGLGPVLGGIITEYLGWPYLFVVTGLSMLSLPFFLKWLPKERIEKGTFDVVGASLTGLSVTGLILYLSTFSIYLLLATVLLFIAWWFYLQHVDKPFIPPTLLKNKQYVKLLFIGGVAFFINFSNLFLMPLLLTTVFGKQPTATGLIIFPGAILAVVAGQFIGKWLDRYGTVPVLVSGQVFLLIATLLFAWCSTIHSFFILFTYLFASVGFTAITSSNSNEVTKILPKAQIGSGVGVLQLMQFFGGALGVAISGLLLTVQEHRSPAVIYQNVYLSFTCLLVAAIIVFVFYYRRMKRKTVVV